MAEEKNEKNKKGNLPIIIAIVILCIGAFGGSYIYFSSKSGEEKEKVVKEAYMECGDSMIINLADESGKRYIKVKVNVGYDEKNKKLAEELTNKQTVIRDAIIFHFKGLESEEVKNQDNKEMKEMLIASINNTLTNGKLEGIYFDEYTVQ